MVKSSNSIFQYFYSLKASRLCVFLYPRTLASLMFLGIHSLSKSIEITLALDMPKLYLTCPLMVSHKSLHFLTSVD